MSREILFRGKRIDNGEWIYGDLVTEKYSTGEIYRWAIVWFDIVNGIQFEDEVDPTTIGQYTGLYDKNGTKIFEGDKIWHSGWHHNLGNSEYGAEYLGAVWYGYDGFCLGSDENGGTQNPYPWEDCEVVGNIHDKEGTK